MTTPSPTPEPRPGIRIGGWEIDRVVGRGGMATVYGATDVETGQRRALKLMNAGGPVEEVERRFRREFRALSRLQHPNITQVFDWGTWEGRPFFVMELVEGVDLRTLVERWQVDSPPDRFEVTRSIVVQAARALEFVHLRGLVHRDVTPSNIMLLPDGRVKLMDFGVVKENDTTELTAHGELLGTVAYIAPEQISGERIDARTDLYSLGAVLYLLLTGRRAFNARTLAGYLDKHLHRPPRPPRELVPNVPRVLEEVCLRLLQKEPSERFASATHLLHVLEGADHRPLTLDPAEWPPVLAGRHEEIAAITNAIGACRDGVGGVVLIEGGAGLGKTRLARLALETARRCGVPALRVRARATGNPLDAYARVYAALREEGLPAPPLLQRIFEQGEGAAERYALFTAFREMVANTRPRVIAVDDLQFADPGSIELVEYLIRNTLALSKEPILWVLTRSPGVQDVALEGIASGSRTEVAPTVLSLRPLTSVAVEELLASILPDGDATRALARRLHREGEGNPAFIGEMVRGLIDDALIRTVDGERRLLLTAEEIPRATLPIPRTVREALLERLNALSDGARQVADVLAVARQEMTLGLLVDASELDETTVLGALDELVEAGLVRERRVETEDHFDFATSRTRDLLYGEIPHPRRRLVHRRIGESLERRFRRRVNLVVEALATHFEQGEVPGKAYPYLLRAGQRLLDRSFVAEALRYFERALAIEPDAREYITLDEADRLLAEVMLLRAEALDHLGRWSDALPDLTRAQTLARELASDALASRAATALGFAARHAQDNAVAAERLLEALALAEKAGDAILRVMPLNGMAGLLWMGGDLEGARRYWVELLAVGESTRDERALGYGYNGLGLVALCKGQSAEARRCFEQSAEVFERLGLLAPLATARVNLVEIHHFTGNLRRGLELAERTFVQARETHHPMGMARGRHHKALLLVDLGRLEQGMEEAREALAMVRALDHKEDELSTLVGLLRAAWALGDHDEVRKGLREAGELLDKFDPEGFAPIIHAWRARVAAMDDDEPLAHLHLQRALEATGTRWPYQECRLDLVLARVYAAMGNPAEATRRAEAAVRRADACGFRFYALKGHRIAANHSTDEAAVARHRRVADALARSLAANLAREDAERFLLQEGTPAAP
ncbi:MAG: protein kinase domain-containing protein [Myxococcota bacterium]